MSEMRGQTVLVTGGANGLGAALGRRFAAQGAAIGILDRDQTALAAAGSSLEAAGAVVATAAADVGDQQQVQAAIARITAAIGPVSVLVNNAGITHIGNFGSGSCAAVREVIDVNLMGSIYCTAACLDNIIAARGGIIAISSVAGFAPLLGRSGYAASKHGLHGFFETLRLELRDTGVRVLLACPSFIRTGIRKGIAETNPGTDRRSRTYGPELSPEQAAGMIFDAYRGGRTRVAVGRTAKLASVVARFAPPLYERMMIRRIRDER